MDREIDNPIRRLAGLLCAQLQTIGATVYRMEITGSGDSTDGSEVHVEPEALQDKFDGLKVTFEQRRDYYDPETKTYKSSTLPQESDFEDAVWALAELLWERANRGGWYNNDGGRCEVTLEPGGWVTYEHIDYTDVGEYDEDGEGDSEMEESTAAHWRFNIFVGPIDAPFEETETTA